MVMNEPYNPYKEPENPYKVVGWAISFFFLGIPAVALAFIAGLFIWCLIFGPVG
jgi:hypothetical protein